MSLSIGLFLLAFALSFSLSLFFIYRSLNDPHPKRRRIGDGGGVLGAKGGDFTRTEADPSLVSRSLSKLIEGNGAGSESEPTHLARSVLLEILGEEEEEDLRSGGGRVRKKKRRAKKKRAESKEGNGGGGGGEGGVCEKGKAGPGSGKPELVCLYPFTSTSSATQRRIKQQYDQLVKCNETKGLTLAQVGEFANCLIEARNELQHKSEVIKRKFTIAKALLFKADRSSIERLHQQIYKLELEQKRLEEDAFVYNWLQQQLKLSPAYKKMVEISSCLEQKVKSHELIENDDPGTSDISFEELLAQEKKDSFWQKNAKSRTCSS